MSPRWAPYEYYFVEDEDIFHRTQKSDVWAFGMTVLELLTGNPPYAYIIADHRVSTEIKMGRLPRKPDINDSDPHTELKHFMWSICLKCWRLKPEERPSMREILEEMLDYPLKDIHSVTVDARRQGISQRN
ncbi:hypothetical protein SCHPADRAFT_849513 [Schizopora paradoxa]|uniref:Protein kinase domain-containing protein n=1 Tax=Schizopora paradoxa TaxID=27342 RepID=A0A0H2RV87_9AGAM|nr:hypothetical protein SCHPADRAFT_849513 [Schizopora paradoxa]